MSISAHSIDHHIAECQAPMFWRGARSNGPCTGRLTCRASSRGRSRPKDRGPFKARPRAFCTMPSSTVWHRQRRLYLEEPSARSLWSMLAAGRVLMGSLGIGFPPRWLGGCWGIEVPRFGMIMGRAVKRDGRRYDDDCLGSVQCGVVFFLALLSDLHNVFSSSKSRHDSIPVQ